MQKQSNQIIAKIIKKEIHEHALSRQQYIIFEKIIINYHSHQFEFQSVDIMNSSNSDALSGEKSVKHYFPQGNQFKKNKDYLCPCGRSYGSYPALYSHIKRKHDGKAPGQVVKPKPLRRRGRPFKYEPPRLQHQNTHKNACRHLENYLKNVQKSDASEFPLKAFAEQDKLRFPFINNGMDFNPMNGYGASIRGAQDIDPGFVLDPYMRRQQDMGRSQRQFFSGGNKYFNQNSPFGTQYNQNGRQFFQSRPEETQQRWSPFQGQDPNLINVHMRGTEEYRNFTNENNLNQMQNGDQRYFNNRKNLSQQLNQGQNGKQPPSVFEGLFSKPYEVALKEEMEMKFKPIAKGISEFLEPILSQLLDASLDEEKPSQIAEIDLNSKSLSQVEGSEREKNDLSQKKSKDEFSIQKLLDNDHFKNILKWLMSPPSQENNMRQKQNYIEFSYRCCLVEFLDFVNEFLETVQYEQILIILVFFCDHILAVTCSFELKPEPQIYEMGLYFNDFINQYLPKLVNCIPKLTKFFMFSSYKKNISELFMWMSSWQAMQQYYHNKYYRKMMTFQIAQESYKCLLYQKKYEFYILEAMKQHTQYDNIRPILQANDNSGVQEKTEENPQIQYVHPGNNTSNFINSDADNVYHFGQQESVQKLVGQLSQNGKEGSSEQQNNSLDSDEESPDIEIKSGSIKSSSVLSAKSQQENSVVDLNEDQQASEQGERQKKQLTQKQKESNQK